MHAQLLQHLLSETAQRIPEQAAAVFEDRELSYGELDRASNQLARSLCEQGVRRGDRVGIYANKSIASAVAVHGVLKSGAAYVPLDPSAPPGRLAYILGNCGVRHLVASTAKAGAIGRILDEGASLDAVAFADEGSVAALPRGPRFVPWTEVEAQSAEPQANGATGDDLAYVLYTSGSTGTPKGVMISHSNALAFVEWAAERYGLSSHDRVSSHAPLHFDLSIFDFYASMKAGATLALIPDGTSTFPIRLSEWIERNRITVWYSVPSILTQLLLKGRLEQRDLSRLRLVLFAGEVFPTKYLRDLVASMPGVRFVNLYGPTETNVITHYEVPTPMAAGQDAPIPIGLACDYADLLVVDETGAQVTESGRRGELYARGPTVARGYWGDPAKTARSFVPDPFLADSEAPVYRTGDLVEWAPDGTLLFQGRQDRMVKSRGYRIELDEIETVLYAHPLVREAAVVAVPDEQIGTRIRAYVSGVDGEELGIGKLREYCLERLPRYMVPEGIEVLPQLPKTSTGKVDRTRLAEAGCANVEVDRARS